MSHHPTLRRRTPRRATGRTLAADKYEIGKLRAAADSRIHCAAAAAHVRRRVLSALADVAADRGGAHAQRSGGTSTSARSSPCGTSSSTTGQTEKVLRRCPSPPCVSRAAHPPREEAAADEWKDLRCQFGNLRMPWHRPEMLEW
ncbi:hypothetical protein EDB87DRAFT_1573659 [Lactarius vividus]|nr:hypothetical protein EDB87DRAFT_1573659 [Lactarius vividus]